MVLGRLQGQHVLRPYALCFRWSQMANNKWSQYIVLEYRYCRFHDFLMDIVMFNIIQLIFLAIVDLWRLAAEAICCIPLFRINTWSSKIGPGFGNATVRPTVPGHGGSKNGGNKNLWWFNECSENCQYYPVFICNLYIIQYTVHTWYLLWLYWCLGHAPFLLGWKTPDAWDLHRGAMYTLFESWICWCETWNQQIGSGIQAAERLMQTYTIYSYIYIYTVDMFEHWLRFIHGVTCSNCFMVFSLCHTSCDLSW